MWVPQTITPLGATNPGLPFHTEQEEMVQPLDFGKEEKCGQGGADSTHSAGTPGRHGGPTLTLRGILGSLNPQGPDTHFLSAPVPPKHQHPEVPGGWVTPDPLPRAHPLWPTIL